MRQVELLKPIPSYIAKSRQVCSARHETREGLVVKGVRAVIVETELLLTREVMIQAECHRVLADSRNGCRAECSASRIRPGNKLVQQIDSRWIKALRRNSVAWE